jgi:hypothetical protein
VGERFGLLDPILREQGAREQCGGLCGIDAETGVAYSTISRADAIMRRAASVRPRSASSTPWQESATASTAGAPWVMRSTRTTSRQRPLARVTGLGPHSAASGAIASTVFARLRSSTRRAAASARSSAASQAPTRPRR